MNTTSLIEWAQTNNIVERTEKGLENYLENWRKEDRGEFFSTFNGKSNLKLLKTELRSIQLTHVNGYSDFVYCNLRILYLGNDIGDYRTVFTLDGVADDDMIHFDKHLERTIHEGTIKVKVIKRAIKEGYTIEEISKLVDLDEDILRPLFIS
ncbi:hypothetical protein [Paenibacillus kobensis]|uniref:hypothetical protein n=1 Tax=Paenibacillus kobensis TaxID=59841 RepID=UPI000FDB1BFB|nr:hypothetical protein [Paenibacillus kobensis]